MQIYAFFMFVGIFTTLLIPETKRKTLEQLAGEVPGTPEFDEQAYSHMQMHLGGGAESNGNIEATEEMTAEKQV